MSLPGAVGAASTPHRRSLWSMVGRPPGSGRLALARLHGGVTSRAGTGGRRLAHGGGLHALALGATGGCLRWRRRQKRQDVRMDRCEGRALQASGGRQRLTMRQAGVVVNRNAASCCARRCPGATLGRPGSGRLRSSGPRCSGAGARRSSPSSDRTSLEDVPRTGLPGEHTAWGVYLSQEPTHADQCECKSAKGAVDGQLLLPANQEPPEGAQPGKGPLNGLITNDKFCLTRTERLQLSWPRARVPHRPAARPYPPNEVTHRGGQHATAAAHLARPADRRADDDGTAALGPGVPAPRAMRNDQSPRAGGPAGAPCPPGGAS